ncbi:MAG: hypothetical protein GVY17_15490 [Cyanobacteria bacterium]|jgi:hypothetical protein|nr:hypothetical protein [Cyanobacteria bacterium GSL.Bin21]
MPEIKLIIDMLQCWHQERLSRDQLMEILVIIAKSPRGRRTIKQIRELLTQALEQS